MLKQSALIEIIPEIVFKISLFDCRDSTISSQISREKMNIYQLNFSFFHDPGGDSTRNCEISLLKMNYLDNGYKYYFCYSALVSVIEWVFLLTRGVFVR